MPAQVLAGLAAIGALTLAGCGVGMQDEAAPKATEVPGVSIEGHVHGGVFPIQNATIRLMVTQSSTESYKDVQGNTHSGGTYGGWAEPLLQTTSDQNGYFTFSDNAWSCNSDQFIYVTVTGGYSINLATTLPNNNVIQVGVIGACSQVATQATFNKVNVFVSELSTVAAAYALGNFISVDNNGGGVHNLAGSTGATSGTAGSATPSGVQIVNISAPDNNNAAAPKCKNTGSSMSCTAAGLAHAFTNAYTLVDSVRFDGSFPTGLARSSNPVNAISSVPQQLINTIGNILQSCVDSIAGAGCSSLFSYTTPTAGTAPTTTLQAAMNMAKYPTNNLSNLYALQPQKEFFTPDLATTPTSFTVSIFYGVTYGGSVVPYPIDIALDAQDDAYVLYGNNSGGSGNYGAVYGLSAAGTPLFSSTPNYNVLYPTEIATDTSGYLYISNNDTYTQSNGAIYMANTSDGVLKQVATQHNSNGLAVDRLNNVWASVANSSDDSVYEYKQTALLTPFLASSYASASSTFRSGVGSYPVTGLAIDGSQNVWGVSGGTSRSIALVLPNTNASTPATTPAYGTAGSAGYTQALATTGGFGLTLSSSGEAYFPLAGELDAATYSSAGGFIVNPPSGHGTATTNSGAPQRSATDGAGNMFWADLEANGLIYEFTPGSSTLTSFLPCFPFPVGSGYSCITTSNQGSYGTYTPSNLRAMAVDSAGDLWYAADAGYGAVIETLGLATPAWPQLSYGHPGSEPQ